MTNDILGHFVFRRSFSGSYFRIMSNPPQKAIYSSRNKSQMAPNEKVLFHGKLGLISTWGKRLCFGRESTVFEETMKEIGSIDEHFPLCGSAWGAIWGRLSKKDLFKKNGVQKMCRFSIFLEGDFGCFRGDFCEFVRIVAWSRDGKWWEGVN